MRSKMKLDSISTNSAVDLIPRAGPRYRGPGCIGTRSRGSQPPEPHVRIRSRFDLFYPPGTNLRQRRPRETNRETGRRPLRYKRYQIAHTRHQHNTDVSHGGCATADAV